MSLDPIRTSQSNQPAVALRDPQPAPAARTGAATPAAPGDRFDPAPQPKDVKAEGDGGGSSSGGGLGDLFKKIADFIEKLLHPDKPKRTAGGGQGNGGANGPDDGR